MADKSIKIPVNKVKTTSVQAGEELVDKLHKAGFEVTNVKADTDCKEIESLQKGLMKVNFSKFVKLVSSWKYEDLLKNYSHKDIIIDSDLLIDLASYKIEDVDDDLEDEEQEGDGYSGIFTGVLIGVMISLILFLIFIR